MGFCRFGLVVLIAGILICPLSADAENLVSGRYLKGAGQEIKIELMISSPAPPLVIVVQHLPKGVKVVAAEPELKKYKPNKGVAKWLLHKVAPGKMTVSLQLDRSVEKGEINGEIRCRDTAGKMVSIPLQN
ncbi:MAG: hypothetical protein KAS94_15430 [Desulfobulbaceae bacterium]|nr:hypothetical protein [Desulfobulbaceae bacterium]